MNYGIYFGIFGVVMVTIGYFFQAYKIYSDKSGENLSYIAFTCIALMNIAQIIYFVSTNDIIGTLGAVIPLIMLFINIIMKYYYANKQKKQVLVK